MIPVRLALGDDFGSGRRTPVTLGTMDDGVRHRALFRSASPIPC